MPFIVLLFMTTSTTEIYTLSLHDALPIFYGELMDAANLFNKYAAPVGYDAWRHLRELVDWVAANWGRQDRKSIRLNSSHRCISYAVFCLKKKKNISK